MAKSQINQSHLVNTLISIKDFFLVRNPDEARSLPDEISLLGKKYLKHMGLIFLPCKPEELSSEQIIELSNLRSAYFDRVVDKSFVQKIYMFVYKLVSNNISKEQQSKGISLLDFGAGTGSFGHYVKFSGINGKYPIEYHAVDLNPKYAGTHTETYKSYKAISENSELPFHDGSFDVIVALYVFHYNIPEVHMKSFVEKMNSEGILLFNLYRPSDKLREEIQSRLRGLGLRWHKIDFESSASFHGMKHAPTEFYLCRKIR